MLHLLARQTAGTGCCASRAEDAIGGDDWGTSAKRRFGSWVKNGSEWLSMVLNGSEWLRMVLNG